MLQRESHKKLRRVERRLDSQGQVKELNKKKAYSHGLNGEKYLCLYFR